MLGGGSGAFGLLMTALGVGAAIGVVTLLVFQRRRSCREQVFIVAIVATGVSIIAVASVSTLTPALFLTAACRRDARAPRTSPASRCCRSSVADDFRGRTFATLYTIVRLCLLLSLTIGPFIASALGTRSRITWVDGDVAIGSWTVSLPGVRLALWLGGLVTVLSGLDGAPAHAPPEPGRDRRRMSTDPGRFVVLEGGEGSGKSTQANVLVKRLVRDGTRRRPHARARATRAWVRRYGSLLAARRLGDRPRGPSCC